MPLIRYLKVQCKTDTLVDIKKYPEARDIFGRYYLKNENF